jgi:SAM-dependent methyltransferase
VLATVVHADVEIVATDLSTEMIDYAAKRNSRQNVTFRQADAQALPFEDSSFEAMACQFGMMFFPNKPQAYREACRVLKRGGRFVFSVWDRIEENELPHTQSQALAQLFPGDPPSFVRRVVFGYNDAHDIERALRDAGFARSAVAVLSKHVKCPSARDYAIGSCHGGPARAEIEVRDSGRLDRATDAVTASLEKRFGSGPITAKSQALVFTAWR